MRAVVAPARAMPSAPSCGMPRPGREPGPVSVISGAAVAIGAAQSTTATAASVVRTTRSLANCLHSGLEARERALRRLRLEAREHRLGGSQAPGLAGVGTPP